MGANIVIDLSNTLKYESTGTFTRKKKSDAGQRSKEFDLGRGGSRAEDRSALVTKTPDLYDQRGSEANREKKALDLGFKYASE